VPLIFRARPSVDDGQPRIGRLNDLAKVCAGHFGGPRVDIQRGKDDSAKAYRVRQVPGAIATHYTYRVTWSAEDGEHVATVAARDPWRAGSAAAELLAVRPRSDEAAEHLPHFHRPRARGHDRIARGECTQLPLIVSLNDSEAPRAARVEHGTEDHHPA
jgi:hypothetical protein